MSSDNSKAAGVVIIIAILLVVGVIIYNSYCGGCINLDVGGGTSTIGGGSSTVKVSTGGGAPSYLGGALLALILVGGGLSGALFYLKKRAAARAAGSGPQGVPVAPSYGSPSGGGTPHVAPHGVGGAVPHPPTKKETAVPTLAEVGHGTRIEEVATEIRAAPAGDPTEEAWRNLLAGGILISGFVYFNSRSIKDHTGWKFHIYADDKKDLYNIATEIIPLLKNTLHAHFKVVPNLSDVGRFNASATQKGKMFTIYLHVNNPHSFNETKARAKEIADELDKIMRKPNLKARGAYKIPGDKLVPTAACGRIFYTYELDKTREEFPRDLDEDVYHGSYTKRVADRKRGNTYNIAGNPDIF